MSLVLITAFSSILSTVSAGTTTFNVPLNPLGSATLDAAPVGISYEFFQFPSYLTNVSHTWSCSAQLQRLTGTWPRIRIGGTSQDRATYDPSLSAYVLYPGYENTFSGPLNFTFGPSFIELAGKYPGTVVMGLNRGGDNLTNTIEAAKAAVNGMKNLYAIELGNEPDSILDPLSWIIKPNCLHFVVYPYTGFNNIAPDPATWTPAAEAASEAEWQLAVGSALRQAHIVQAGAFESSPANFSAMELIENDRSANSRALTYIKDFSHHNYPQSTYFTVDLQSLMSHESVVSNVGEFERDVVAAEKEGWEYVFGETNSVSGGGSNITSPTFGSALWLLDYALRSASIGVRRNYFHQCTIGICYYSFWDRTNINAPFYGAYVAAAAMAGATYISGLDEGTSNYGGYVVYSSDRTMMRVILVNTDYYSGNATRPSETIVVKGLKGRRVRTRRFTAPSALSRVDEGEVPSFGGQSFDKDNCDLIGGAVTEDIKVTEGTASLNVAASEAVIIDLSE